MITRDEAREEDYRRRHGGMSRAEEIARDAHGLDTALPEESAATRELLPDDAEGSCLCDGWYSAEDGIPCPVHDRVLCDGGDVAPDLWFSRTPLWPTFALCPEGHECREGEVCSTCHHGCSMPGDPQCPGHEGDAPGIEPGISRAGS